MPSACFSYSADVPPGTGIRDAVQPDPPGLRRMPASSACFRYEADVPPGLRRMPAEQRLLQVRGRYAAGRAGCPATHCFRY